jgi:hypothetical protein
VYWFVVLGVWATGWGGWVVGRGLLVVLCVLVCGLGGVDYRMGRLGVRQRATSCALCTGLWFWGCGLQDGADGW